jgi:hypothetical protein
MISQNFNGAVQVAFFYFKRQGVLLKFGGESGRKTETPFLQKSTPSGGF